MGCLNWMPQLSKCCCCVNLQVGSIILGYLAYLGIILNLVSTCFDYFFNQSPYIIPTPEEAQQKSIVFMITIGCYVVGFAYSSLLLYGAFNKDVLCLKIYVYIQLIGIVAMVVFTIVLIFLDYTLAISSGIGVCISAYYWFCINSFLQEILAEEVPFNTLE